MNFSIKNRGKFFLFILTDHGSANIIKSLIRKYNLKKCRFYFISEKTKKIFKKFKKNFINKKDKIKFSNFDYVIVGTGANEKKYYQILKKISNKSKIYFLIDHWLCIKQRLNFRILNYHKVNLLFSDVNKVNNIVKNKLKNSKAYIVKNYFMEDIMKKIKLNKKYIYKYLYVDDLASYVKNKKLEKKIHYDCIRNFFLFLKTKKKKNIKVLIRSHPSDKNNIARKVVSKLQDEFNIQGIDFIFSKYSLMKDLSLSQNVIGSQSSALLLSKKLGKPTYTCLKDKFLNKFASNSPLFKKILV